MLQQPIAAVARASTSNRKRWIAIYPTIDRQIALQPPHLYRVIDTEFDAVLLEVHREQGDADLAIVNQAEYYAANVTELYVLLTNLEIDPESFNTPWHVEQPLL